MRKSKCHYFNSFLRKNLKFFFEFWELFENLCVFVACARTPSGIILLFSVRPQRMYQLRKLFCLCKDIFTDVETWSVVYGMKLIGSIPKTNTVQWKQFLARLQKIRKVRKVNLERASSICEQVHLVLWLSVPEITEKRFSKRLSVELSLSFRSNTRLVWWPKRSFSFDISCSTVGSFPKLFFKCEFCDYLQCRIFNFRAQ